MQHQEGGDEQRRGDEKDGLGGEQIAEAAHHRGGESRANRGKTRIAPEALADRCVSDEAEADRRDGRPEDAARRGMQRRSRQHGREDRPCRVDERAGGDQRDRDAGDAAHRTDGIDQSAARHLAHQGDDGRDRQDEADFDLSPLLRRQVDGDEGAEAGLHVGDKEDEPVEPLQAAPGGMGR